MLFLPVNGCISIKCPICPLLLLLNPCQSDERPARKNEIYQSGSDKRERTVPSALKGQSVLFYHYRSSII